MKVRLVRVPEPVFAALCQTAALTGGLEMDKLLCAAASSFGRLDDGAKQWLVRGYWLEGVREPRPEKPKSTWKENLYVLVRRAYSTLRHAVAS
jgi:hypothetical protein